MIDARRNVYETKDYQYMVNVWIEKPLDVDEKQINDLYGAIIMAVEFRIVHEHSQTHVVWVGGWVVLTFAAQWGDIHYNACTMVTRTTSPIGLKTLGGGLVNYQSSLPTDTGRPVGHTTNSTWLFH